MSKLHWLALASVPGIGGSTARRLVERFGGAEAVFGAPDEELLAVSRMTEAIVGAIRALDLDLVERQMDELSASGVQILTLDDADEGYPANLRDASDAPALLYVAGDVLPGDTAAIAIVGTREPSQDSAQVAFNLAKALAERGIAIVSGLALGIDAAAHRGALDADGGRTIGVLGSGLNRIHPRDNALLAQEIAERGAVVSELAPNVPPQGVHLMARDRIISGLSRAVIVVEAAEKSGSIDTANRARRQGRGVYAVPGSPGTDALLRGSARLCETSSAFLDQLASSLSVLHDEDSPPQLSLFGA